jgi:hypothetical protein
VEKNGMWLPKGGNELNRGKVFIGLNGRKILKRGKTRI